MLDECDELIKVSVYGHKRKSWQFKVKWTKIKN